MPFRHPGPRDPLVARIDAEVRGRLEEAVDHACLEAMVAARRARGLPAPAPDSPEDRREFERGVLAFLRRLADELARDPREEARAASGTEPDGAAGRLLALQVTLAKSLPDYWQRFDLIRATWLTDQGLEERAEFPGGLGGRPERPDTTSGRYARGLLARLFGRR